MLLRGRGGRVQVVDVDLVLRRLGPKLEWELAQWYPAERIDAMATRYRELYWEHCAGGGTLLLPGARESVAAVRARGRIEWDAAAGRVTNNNDANQFIGPGYAYRSGWGV